jgi:hypothetical protein
MSTRARRFAAMSLPLAASLAAATARAQTSPEEIGSWVVSCPLDTTLRTPAPAAPKSATGAVGTVTAGRCEMRHRTWVLPPGAGPLRAALEVQRRGERLEPVVTLRGLSGPTALGATLAVQASVELRLDAGAQMPLSCTADGAAIVCAPAAADAAASAEQLPTARSAAVQIQLRLPGAMTLPAQDRTLELQSTPQALARFRLLGPAGEAEPIEAGLDWRGFLDHVLRAAGFHNGVADLLRMALPWATGGKA